jgi:hypothetical protein
VVFAAGLHPFLARQAPAGRHLGECPLPRHPQSELSRPGGWPPETDPGATPGTVLICHKPTAIREPGGGLSVNRQTIPASLYQEDKRGTPSPPPVGVGGVLAQERGHIQGLGRLLSQHRSPGPRRFCS